MEQVQEIHSLRVYSKISGNRLSILLPKNFDFQEVEVIIIPRELKSDSNIPEIKTDWKTDFLSISKWDISEEEIKIKSWTIQEF